MEAAKQQGCEVRIYPAMSFLDALLVSLKLSPTIGLQVLDGLSVNEQAPQTTGPVIVTQVYNSLVAGDVKITLLEHYPPEHVVTVVKAAGVPGKERIERIPLWELDQLDWLDHLTCVYLPECEHRCIDEAEVEPQTSARNLPLDRLAGLMARLRLPGGCPWDREQDHNTLRQYLLEETYEVLEALQEKDRSKLCEELGDLLLQIVFHAQIASENGDFDLTDVIDGICEKIIRRHPHVFGTISVKDSREVNRNWEIIKAREKVEVPSSRLLDSVSRNMPILTRAAKLQKKAATVGFDWPDYHGAMEKIYEELNELQQALSDGVVEQIEKETGDLFFSMINLARLLNVDAEIALFGASERFIKRFNYVEKKAVENRVKLVNCSPHLMNIWWDEAKTLEK